MSLDPQTPSAAASLAEQQQQQQQFDPSSPSPSPSPSPSLSPSPSPSPSRHQHEHEHQHQHQHQHDACAASESPPPSLVQSTPLQLQCAGLMTPVSEKHPKGKRKRTPTKDRLILEEAYTNNPKPDKQARLEIVGRVSLNEKEVQIWFQNRRQNDRRKSRPLSPQELVALRFGGLHGTSDTVLSQSFVAESDKTFPASDLAVDRALASSQAPFSPQHSGPRPHRHPSDAVVNATPRFTSYNTSASSLAHVTPPQRQEFASSQASQDTAQFAQSFSSTVGYLANRWNISFSTPSTLARRNDSAFKLEFSPWGSSSPPPSSTPNLPNMRLSLSLEGKAKLVSDATSPEIETPSRPASTLPDLPQAPPRGLQRSHSALPAITLPPISTLTNSLPPRLGRGRSRDVQAWELCADSDTRDELITQAEYESNGSAVAAISLLRCKAGGGVLQPSGTKRNAPVAQLPRIKKPNLGRSSSGVAGWERPAGAAEKSREALGGKMNVSMLVSPSDSDKENWSPGGYGNLEGRRRPLPASPLKSHNPRRVGRALQCNKSPSFLSNRASTAPSALLRGLVKGVEIFRDEDSKTDAPREDEVDRLMRSEESPIKKGDMDCVAGLLSLSQGAWR